MKIKKNEMLFGLSIESIFLYRNRLKLSNNLKQSYNKMTTNNNQQRINNATDKVVDYMYREEDRHFREWIDDEDKKDPVKFIAKLREHIFYSVVTLKFKGDAKELNEWVNQYWDDNGEPEDEEPKEEEKV